MHRKIATTATKIGLAGHEDLALELIAAQEQAEIKKWHKIVAKIPGVCSYLRRRESSIKNGIERGKEILKDIKILEKDLSEKNEATLRDLYVRALLLVEYGAEHTDDVDVVDAMDLLELQKRVQKAGGLKNYIKTSEFVLKLKKDRKMGPISEACKQLKKKK